MPEPSESNPLLIAITMGDPCGVGPEVIVKAFASSAAQWHEQDLLPFVVGADLPLRRAIDLLNAGLTVKEVGTPIHETMHGEPGTIPLLSVGKLTRDDIVFGRPTPSACKATVSCIETAARLALAGQIDSVCTCPINKEHLHQNGFPFPGHTEFIREITGAEQVVMMLAGPKLRVSLATIHEPLAKVPELLTKDRLRVTIGITADALLRDFGVKSPRIGVAGLNPHAGEAGKFGREEIELIEPVVHEFSADSRFRISGPWPSDTIFNRAVNGDFDAVVAMYHDQGLIPVKLLHFSEAVNISLGLPIVRTSVDHGTAYDKAGTGTASEGSLVAAVDLAARIAMNRRSAG